MRRTAVVLLGMFPFVTAAPDSLSLVSVPNGLGPGYFTYDLVHHVEYGSWNSTALKATISGATFFQHPVGAITQPNPELLALFPSLAWDTFITCPEGWPNTPDYGIAPTCAGTCTMTTTLLDATFFETPPNGGVGDWIVARITIEAPTPGWSATISGASTNVNGWWGPYEFKVPEPGGLMLLGLAALALRRTPV